MDNRILMGTNLYLYQSLTFLYSIMQNPSNPSAIQVQLGDIKGFAVHPKTDCTHITIQNINITHKLFDAVKSLILPGVCKDCGSKEENWLCLVCNGVFCSRYVKGHMSEHNHNQKHQVALSFTDGSIWCYACDSYITSTPLTMLQIKFSGIKFPDGDDSAALDQLTQVFQQSLKIQEKKQDEPKIDLKEKSQKYTREKFIQDIKNRKSKKIVFLTGAGISVSAGIPDFRSPGSGLYSKLASYNLPTPEAVFQIDYFKKNPQPFYKLSKELFSTSIKPTISHKFIKRMDDQELLLKAITQNIDSLQIQAGLPQYKLIQAHGHNRSVHCLQCQKTVLAEVFNKAIDDNVVLRCQCGGLVKPDIVFFGQQLPKSFHEAPQIMRNADLVVVMGTSLVVFPFAFLVQMIEKETPVVLINNTNSLQSGFPNALWLDGDLDSQIKRLCEDLGWDI